MPKHFSHFRQKNALIFVLKTGFGNNKLLFWAKIFNGEQWAKPKGLKHAAGSNLENTKNRYFKVVAT